MQAFIGYAVTTLLMFFLRRGMSSSTDTSNTQQASKYTDSNVNNIGDPIPVVLGRGMIKNPLVSFYGDYSYAAYTEEYGMHSSFSWSSLLWPLIFGILAVVMTPNTVVTTMGPGVETSQGAKNAMILNVVFTVLMFILSAMFGDHAGRTTIQKGFKYYLGWQHIICWTGANIGIKKIWMNVYDSDLEESTETGIWDNDNHVAYKSENPMGIIAHIDDDDMFGGVDEQGGFVGDIRMYLGTEEQGRDSWMSDQMTKSENIPDSLKGLTPVYPMFVTAVIPTAYIGKQATIPEMWFEIVNYTSQLYDEYKPIFKYKYIDAFRDGSEKLVNYFNNEFEWSLLDEGPDVKIRTLTELLDEYNDGQEEKSYLDILNGILDKLLATDPKHPTELLRVLLAILSSAEYKNKFSDASRTLNKYWEYMEQIEDCQLYGNNDLLEGLNQKLSECVQSIDDLHTELHEKYLNSITNVLTEIYNNVPYPVSDTIQYYIDQFKILDHYDTYRISKLGDDLNPAEVIFQMLFNTYWGGAYIRRSRVDIMSLITLGMVCEDEGLGVSCVIDSVNTINAYVTKVLNHVNAVKFDDPTTGKLTFKAIRADYDADSLPVFDVSNCTSLTFTRLDWSQTSSTVSVSFTDPDRKYATGQLNLNDPANNLITHLYAETSVDGNYFTTATNARYLAQVSLLSAAYPLASIEILCNRSGHDVTVGDPISVTWEPYGISKQIFRVSNVDYATLTSGTISITAVEDVFGFDALKYKYSDIIDWQDPSANLEDVHYYRFIEWPYELQISLDTYIKAVAVQPSSGMVTWNIWRYVGNTYKITNSSTIWGAAVLISTFMYANYTDDDNFHGSPVGSSSRGQLEARMKLIEDNLEQYTARSGLNLAIIEDEIIAYNALEYSPNGDFIFKGVIRGVYDTLPKEHNTFTPCYLLSPNLDVNMNNPVASAGKYADEQLEIRTGSVSDTQAFDLDKLVHFYGKRRSEAPSVMANLQYSADLGDLSVFQYNFPAGTIFTCDLIFNFLPRNKFYRSDVFAQTEELDVIPEEDVIYRISCSCRDKVFNCDYPTTIIDEDLDSSELSKQMRFTWGNFCREMDNQLKEVNSVSIQICSYNTSKELQSYDYYEKVLFYNVPKFVGGFVDDEDLESVVQEYANSITTETLVEVPKSNYTEAFTMTFAEGAIIPIAKEIDGNSPIKNQNGVGLSLNGKAYRIVGYDRDSESAVISEITLDDYFVFSSTFNSSQYNVRNYYKNVLGTWAQIQLDD